MVERGDRITGWSGVLDVEVADGGGVCCEVACLRGWTDR